jgi:hypothetical protein
MEDMVRGANLALAMTAPQSPGDTLAHAGRGRRRARPGRGAG